MFFFQMKHVNVMFTKHFIFFNLKNVFSKPKQSENLVKFDHKHFSFKILKF